MFRVREALCRSEGTRQEGCGDPGENQSLWKERMGKREDLWGAGCWKEFWLRSRCGVQVMGGDGKAKDV